MLGGFALALGKICVAGSIHVHLHHEAQGWKLPPNRHQPSQDFLPPRTSEEVIIDQEKGVNAMISHRIAHPFHYRLRLSRTHRASHHVLDAAVRAGERTSP